MPTGYTAKLYVGEQSFRDFVLTCARAFGACIDMREDSLDKAIPDKFEPTKYHIEQIEKYKKELKRYVTMLSEDAENECEKEYQAEVKSYEKNIERQAKLKQRYESMSRKVKAWKLSTPDHQGLKNYMVQQLEESIKFDCGYKSEKPKRLTTIRWLDEQIASAKRNIEYHTEENRKEVERTNERNQWIAELRKSLEGEI